MDNILPINSSLTLPDFTLVSASAGSGKTTALTRRYLQILLSDSIPHRDLRNILAITFTNNAAAEMKQRILTVLKKAYLRDPETIARLSTVLSFDEGVLAARAGELVGTILDNYSDFQVQTIDSFLTRILKVSAVDFGWSPDFAITLETRRLLDDVFESVAEELTENREIRSTFTQLVALLGEAKDNSGRFLWDPFGNIKRNIGKIHGKLSASAGLPLVPDLSTRLGEISRRIIAIADNLENSIRQSGLEPQSWLGEFLQTVRKGDISDILGRKPDREMFKKASAASHAAAAGTVEEIRRELNEAIGEFAECRAELSVAPYLRAYDLIQRSIRQAERERREISLGEGTRQLARTISDAFIPDVYFSLGERIHHFLIDEFQDTSPLQWAALKPLIENSLAQEGSLFLVGDTKQAIFTFRGGDWRIMDTIARQSPFPSVPTRGDTLDINYRSGEYLVTFTRDLFRTITEHDDAGEAASKSGLATYVQHVSDAGRGRGYVEVTVLEAPAEDDDPDLAAVQEREKLLSVIRDCIGRGYTYRDIAILARRNADVVDASRWLNEAGIPFLSHSNLDIRSRRVISELLSLLRFLDSPIDNLAFASFILGRILRTSLETSEIKADLTDLVFKHRCSEDRNEPLYVALREKYPAVWDRYFESLFRRVGYLPLYDLVATVFAELDLFRIAGEETAVLVKFLDVVRKFESEEMNTLKDFLRFGDDYSDEASWTIQVPKSENAVTAMTIHKAKGLEFPVTLVLLQDTDEKPEGMLTHETAEGIHLYRTTANSRKWSAVLSRVHAEKKLLTLVDELNQLYVALTRASEEMYLIAVRNKDAGFAVSSLLPPHGTILGNKQTPGPRTDEKPPVAPVRYPTSVRIPGERDPGEMAYVETKRGEFLHGLLARIIYLAPETEESIRAAWEGCPLFCPKGIDGQSELAILRAFLHRREVRTWFVPAENRTVLNEQELADDRGRLFRADRIVIDPGVVTVIDYKTGAERMEYAEQVGGYMKLLRDVYPGRTINGLILYIDRALVKEVS